MRTAMLTGASRGLGRALAATLSSLGWRVVVDARSASDLHAAADGWPHAVVVPGDITDEIHLRDIVDAAG